MDKFEPDDPKAAGPDSLLFSNRGRDLLLAAWLFFAVVFCTARAQQRVGDWSYFSPAGRTLGSARWLYVYIDNPRAQTGPLTIAIAWLINPIGSPAVRTIILLSGLGALALIGWSSRGITNVRWRMGIGGVALALWWPQLGDYGHLDDALMLILSVGAIVLARRGQTFLVAVVAGVAIGVKPTAVLLLALTLPTNNLRSKVAWLPVLIAAAIAGLIWAPFVFGTGETLRALKPTISIQADSVLALVQREGSDPSAIFRAGQLLAMVAVTALAYRKRGPSSVLLVGTAMRLLTDPAAWPYYTPGFVLGALTWEAFESRGRVPWLTVAGALLLAPSWLVDSDLTRSYLRLLLCTASVVVVFARPPRPIVPQLEVCDWEEGASRVP